MNTLTVVNRYKNPDYDFYFGRGTPLGNPYVMSDDMTRDKSCELYEDYFHTNISTDINMKVAVARIIQKLEFSDVAIACSCKPHRCHLDTVKTHIDKLRNNK